MREIRFKAYHKEENKICEVNLVNIDQGCYLLGAKPGKDQIIDGGKSYIEAPKDGRFCYWHEIELMQFSGLTDKNGKEIYEGDIVKIYNWGGKYEELGIGKVCWDVDDNGWTWKSNYGWSMLEGYEVSTYDRWRNVEIIGNIHQNPELLTNKTK